MASYLIHFGSPLMLGSSWTRILRPPVSRNCESSWHRQRMTLQVFALAVMSPLSSPLSQLSVTGAVMLWHLRSLLTRRFALFLYPRPHPIASQVTCFQPVIFKSILLIVWNINIFRFHVSSCPLSILSNILYTVHIYVIYDIDDILNIWTFKRSCSL